MKKAIKCGSMMYNFVDNEFQPCTYPFKNPSFYDECGPFVRRLKHYLSRFWSNLEIVSEDSF